MQLEEGNVDKECRGEHSDQHHQHHSHHQQSHQTGHHQLPVSDKSNTNQQQTSSDMTAHGKMAAAAAAAQGATTGPQTQQGKHKTCTYTTYNSKDNFRILPIKGVNFN